MRRSNATWSSVLQQLRQTDRRPISLVQPRPGRVQEHVRLLGLFWLALSAFNTIASVILYVLANTLFAHMRELGAPEAPTSFLRPC